MSESAATREQHTLAFEEFDVRVAVEANGDVWVSFHESGKCAFTISTGDLAEVILFVEKHGDVNVVQRDD